MRSLYFNSLLILSVLITLGLSANENFVEFSAIAVQKIPDQNEYVTKMYVSKNIVRKDSIMNGTEVIEIFNVNKQIRYFLIPKNKIYMQQQGSQPIENINTTLSKDNSKPCDGFNDTTCELIGKETINERPAEKWEFIVKKEGKFYRSLHWIDVERRILVKEFFPDGKISELIPMGNEIINQRQTEKWLSRLSSADGQLKSATQWFDPELKITIREELDNGFIRELRDVKIAKQDMSIFEIPNGYTLVQNLQGYLQKQESIAPTNTADKSNTK